MLSILAIVSCKRKKKQHNQLKPLLSRVLLLQQLKSPDGTSISVGKDGIDVSTKNGSNETNVTVGAGDASVEVKK
jgi:hypothetical protein